MKLRNDVANAPNFVGLGHTHMVQGKCSGIIMVRYLKILNTQITTQMLVSHGMLEGSLSFISIEK